MCGSGIILRAGDLMCHLTILLSTTNNPTYSTQTHRWSHGQQRDKVFNVPLLQCIQLNLCRNVWRQSTSGSRQSGRDRSSAATPTASSQRGGRPDSTSSPGGVSSPQSNVWANNHGAKAVTGRGNSVEETTVPLGGFNRDDVKEYMKRGLSSNGYVNKMLIVIRSFYRGSVWR